VPGPTKILRVGNGPQFIATSEGDGPEAFKPHVGFGVQGFNGDQVMARLTEHGVNALKHERDGVTEILVGRHRNRVAGRQLLRQPQLLAASTMNPDLTGRPMLLPCHWRQFAAP
jgi:hypothetical protein